jgi:hypothetical protein
MGTGTDVAMESAGITLVRGDLGALVRARRLSQATTRNIRQNLFFGVRLQRRGRANRRGASLSSILGILLNPMWASAAMSLSSVSVIANALRLRRVRCEGASGSELVVPGRRRVAVVARGGIEDRAAIPPHGRVQLGSATRESNMRR